MKVKYHKSMDYALLAVAAQHQGDAEAAAEALQKAASLEGAEQAMEELSKFIATFPNKTEPKSALAKLLAQAAEETAEDDDDDDDEDVLEDDEDMGDDDDDGDDEDEEDSSVEAAALRRTARNLRGMKGSRRRVAS